MSCKRLNAVLIWFIEYKSQLKQKIYKTKLTYKIFRVKELVKKYWIKTSTNKYNVSYCVSYKPVWTLERILLRGWWNDKGIWTEDWIFNDWII